MKRTIIKINENLCNGCGFCVEGCHEGALQLIDGKARVINEMFCDGLGACIGECPMGAIEFEEKEAQPYNEYAVMEKLSSKGEETIKAHLIHLKEHNEMEYHNQGLQYLKEHNINIDLGDNITSQLSQWPIQLHLINPQASYFNNADVILSADCSAYTFGSFHNRFLKNHSLAIACPKLDAKKENYIEKIISMIDISNINTLTIIIMEVPCCGGLLQLAKKAVDEASRKIPIKNIIIGIKGNILKEEWI